MKKQSIRLRIEFTDDSDGRWDNIFYLLEETLHLGKIKCPTVRHTDERLEKSTDCIESESENRLT